MSEQRERNETALAFSPTHLVMFEPHLAPSYPERRLDRPASTVYEARSGYGYRTLAWTALQIGVEPVLSSRICRPMRSS